VVRDREGKPYTVRYEAVNAMLLNEFLKEHRKVEDLKEEMAAPRRAAQRAGRTNPKNERPNPGEPPCAVSRGQSALKATGHHKLEHFNNSALNKN
jgi:hypothetical protein